MSTLAEIEALTRAYRERRDILAGHLEALDYHVQELKRKAMPGIRQAQREASDARARLAAAIEASPHLFQRPRTLVIAGIRVGVEKGKGKIVWDDPQAVVRKIERLLPDQADALIKTTKAPIRKALAALDVGTLKRLGVRVEESGDQVVIRPTDGDIEKLVQALIDEAERQAERAAPEEAAP